jgi:hypothetical protein
MAQETRTRKMFDSPKRKARGFLQAGGLIGQQMRTAQARRGFAQARLQTLWPDIVGHEIAALCAPEALAAARGPSGGLLKLAVSGAHAPQVQMMLPTIRDRINAALGPGTVGRIQLIHSHPRAEAGSRDRKNFRQVTPAPALPGEVSDTLSSIGDEELRDALNTLARNVLSRSGRSRITES